MTGKQTIGNHSPGVSEYYEFVYNLIHRFTKISEGDFRLLIPFLELRSYPKKAVILNEGDPENYLSVVVKGLVRKYITVNKKEITTQLATEGHIVQAEISFHTRNPSEVAIEAIEPTTLICMHYDNVQKALQEIPNAEEIGRMIITYMFIKKDARSYLQLKKNTRQRFLEYLTDHPHMLQRVPQKILASYLQIKPETFSRLKHLVLRK